MTPVLTVVAALLVGTPAACYLVGNDRIVVLPTCDFSPAAVDALRREINPIAARARDSTGPAAAAQRFTRASGVAPRARPRARERLQRQLVAAEEGRRAAERQRATALRDLAATRRELAAARARLDRRADAGPAGRSGAPPARAP